MTLESTARDVQLASLADLPDNTPFAANVAGVDLVLIRRGGDVKALYGRCAHRGVLLADGHIDGDTVVCDVHGWRYNVETGISPVNPAVALATFPVQIRDGAVYVDVSAISEFANANPQPYGDDGYQGRWATPANTAEEPFNTDIHELATHGLSRVGKHGPSAAMGVSRTELPSWDSIQLVTAQLARLPLLDQEPVSTETVIGPGAKRPLVLDIPLFVSDMSFGALSEEAKTALAAGGRTRRHRNLLRRGRHAPRRATREFAVLLRTRIRPVRVELRTPPQSSGIPLQGRTGRQNRYRRASSGQQSGGKDR